MLESSKTVGEGSPIFGTANAALDIRLRRLEAELAQVQTLEQLSLANPDLVVPVSKRRDAIEGQLAKLKEDMASLQYKSPLDGIWGSTPIRDLPQRLAQPRLQGGYGA